MLIRQSRPGDTANIQPSEITPESVYFDRRRLAPGSARCRRRRPGRRLVRTRIVRRPRAAGIQAQREATAPPKRRTATRTSPRTTTSTNSASTRARPLPTPGRFKPAPWTVTVSGEAESTGKFALEDVLKGHALEERVYRLRCVEAWSMVIPWVGVPLGEVLKRFKPTSKAKYVAFKTDCMRPRRDAGQRVPGIARMAVCRRAAYRRSDASARDPRRRAVRQGVAEPERRADAANRRALEVRLQGHQVDRRRSASLSASRRHRGTSRRRMSTAFTPTSTRRSTIPAGARHASGASAVGCSSRAWRRQMFNGYGQEVAALYKGMDLKKFY